MIEVDGKVYRNLQEQVKKNMDDIETLTDKVNEKIHNVTIEGRHNNTYWVIKFLIKNEEQDAYTTASEVYEALKEAFPVQYQNIPCDGAVLFSDHIEIPYIAILDENTEKTFSFAWYGTNGDSGEGDDLSIEWITKVVDQVL